MSSFSFRPYVDFLGSHLDLDPGYLGPTNRDVYFLGYWTLGVNRFQLRGAFLLLVVLVNLDRHSGPTSLFSPRRHPKRDLCVSRIGNRLRTWRPRRLCLELSWIWGFGVVVRVKTSCCLSGAGGDIPLSSPVVRSFHGRPRMFWITAIYQPFVSIPSPWRSLACG